jgi:hypothetical protein
VLSGADPGRHWSLPMTLVDVARAAEVEEYQRVESLPLADLEMAGHAAVDVIHLLLAELINNATSPSPGCRGCTSSDASAKAAASGCGPPGTAG